MINWGLSFVVLTQFEKKVNDADYTGFAPDRMKSKRMCHVNMLKDFWYILYWGDGKKTVLSQNAVTIDTWDENENPGNDFVMDCRGCDNDGEYWHTE